MTRLLLIYLVMTVAYAFLRIPVGQAMNYVLGGLVTTLYVPLFITILLLSVITGSYSSLLLNRFVDQKQLKQSQAKMREFQQVYREAQLAGDKGKLKKLEKERAEVMELEHGRPSTDNEAHAIHSDHLATAFWLAKLHNVASRLLADPRVNYDQFTLFWNTAVHSRCHPRFSGLAHLVPSLLTRLYSSHPQDFGNVTCNRIRVQPVSCQFSRALSPLSPKGPFRFHTQPRLSRAFSLSQLKSSSTRFTVSASASVLIDVPEK